MFLNRGADSKCEAGEICPHLGCLWKFWILLLTLYYTILRMWYTYDSLFSASLVPRLSRERRNRAWYPLLAHAWQHSIVFVYLCLLPHIHDITIAGQALLNVCYTGMNQWLVSLNIVLPFVDCLVIVVSLLRTPGYEVYLYSSLARSFACWIVIRAQEGCGLKGWTKLVVVCESDIFGYYLIVILGAFSGGSRGVWTNPPFCLAF